MTDTNSTDPKRPGKVLVPLENNPEVLTHLLHTLGTRPTLTFHDIYSFDRSSGLLDFIPRPVHALILIVPAHVYHPARDAEDAELSPYQGAGPDEPVLWFRQTIGNTCGTMAALHAVSNGAARRHVVPGSSLDALLNDAVALGPEPRAKLLYDSQALEDAHAAAATLGDTKAPLASDPIGNHFIALVKADDGNLWELNGGMRGPVCRGPLGKDEDALSETALDLGVRPFLKVAEGMGDGEIGFSVVALAEGNVSD